MRRQPGHRTFRTFLMSVRKCLGPNVRRCPVCPGNVRLYVRLAKRSLGGGALDEMVFEVTGGVEKDSLPWGSGPRGVVFRVRRPFFLGKIKEI